MPLQRGSESLLKIEVTSLAFILRRSSNRNITSANEFTMRSLSLPSTIFAIFIGLCSPVANGALVTQDLASTQLDAKASTGFALDVDQDGQVDFNFQTFFSNDAVFLLGFDQVKVPFGSANGLVIGAASADGFPSASLLIPGNVAGPGNVFSAGSFDTANLYSSDPFMGATGNFAGKRGALGFRFDSSGVFRYGYIDIAVNDINSLTPFDVTLFSVSYDNAGGQVTVAGIPEPTGFALVGIVMLASLLNIRHRRPLREATRDKFGVE